MYFSRMLVGGKRALRSLSLAATGSSKSKSRSASQSGPGSGSGSQGGKPGKGRGANKGSRAGAEGPKRGTSTGRGRGTSKPRAEPPPPPPTAAPPSTPHDRPRPTAAIQPPDVKSPPDRGGKVHRQRERTAAGSRGRSHSHVAGASERDANIGRPIPLIKDTLGAASPSPSPSPIPTTCTCAGNDQQQRPASREDDYSFSEFQRIDAINEWMERCAGRLPQCAAPIVGGHTSEGRQIRGLCLFPDAEKPRVVIEAGMHAQEWITTSTATWIIHQLLHGGNPSIDKAARRYEWHILPNVNPDGYEYSFAVSRTWRKTRSKGIVCYGVDGNRNWETGWSPGDRVSRNPCTRNYPGRAPFCEAETRSLSRYVRGLLPRLQVYISLHSSKQMILFPWGHTKEQSKDHDELMEIGSKAANALHRVHGTRFVVGPIATTIYVAPGNSVDWVYSIGVKYAFAMELRNPVKPERFVSASEIVATGEETLQAILTILDEVALRTRGRTRSRRPRDG